MVVGVGDGGGWNERIVDCEGRRVVMGGEEEGWEKMACCGGFIKQQAHMNFE